MKELIPETAVSRHGRPPTSLATACPGSSLCSQVLAIALQVVWQKTTSCPGSDWGAIVVPAVVVLGGLSSIVLALYRGLGALSGCALIFGLAVATGVVLLFEFLLTFGGCGANLT
jgi:hypothetical protein